MATDIVRPAGDPYPMIYKEFEGKVECKDGKKRQYWIQDLTEEYFDEVVKGFVEKFLDDEPISKYTKCTANPDGIKEFEAVWREALGQKISLICLTKDDEGKIRIAGYNCLYVARKDDKPLEFKTATIRKVFNLMTYVTHQRNPFEEFNIDKHLSAMGLYVNQDFRGEGLGEIILNTRRDIGKYLGFKASLTTFTSFISQKQADRAGFKDYVTYSYEELGKINKDFEIPGIQEHSKLLKYMYTLYE